MKINWLYLCLDIMTQYVTQNTTNLIVNRNQELFEHYNEATNIYGERMKRYLIGLGNNDQHIFEKRMGLDLVSALQIMADSCACLTLFSTQAIDSFVGELKENGMQNVIDHLEKTVDGFADYTSKDSNAE